MDDSVYNSTTISYENPNGGVSMSGNGGQRRPWNLAEMPARSRWFHWILLMSGSIILGLGLIMVVIGIYNQHYYNPESQNVQKKENEPPPNHWVITLMGFILIVIGLSLLVMYCRMLNTNRLLCNPLARTRSALRQVVTKPRFQNGGANLLSNEGGPMVGTQYNPVQDIGYHHRQTNGEVSSEEKAKLMAHEVKEGLKMSMPKGSILKSSQGQPQAPRPKFQVITQTPTSTPTALPGRSVVQVPLSAPSPPVRPARHKFSSLRRDVDPYPNPSQSHYKPRHFAGHGYGPGPSKLPSSVPMHQAPLASQEDISPSLRSSFASVMMYPPSAPASDWGNSVSNSDVDDDFEDNVSCDSSVFLNLPPAKSDEDRAKDRELCDRDEEDYDYEDDDSADREKILDNVLRKSYANDDANSGGGEKFRSFTNVRISPKRHGRKTSLDSLSVQSAFS